MDLWIIHCSSEQNEKHVPQYCFFWPLIWMWWPVNKCSFNFTQKWLTENELEAYTEPSTVTVFPFVLSLILLLASVWPPCPFLLGFRTVLQVHWLQSKFQNLSQHRHTMRMCINSALVHAFHLGEPDVYCGAGKDKHLLYPASDDLQVTKTGNTTITTSKVEAAVALT